MNPIESKLQEDENKRYVKAKHDLLEVLKSFDTLSPQQQKRLLAEVCQAETFVMMMQYMGKVKS